MAVKEKLSVSLDRDVVQKVRDDLLRLQATSLARLMSEHGVTLSAEFLAKVEAEWPSRA